jgi:hypothetical protein
MHRLLDILDDAGAFLACSALVAVILAICVAFGA